MEYLLKASGLLILFYACYQLFLVRETFFQSNRWFLLFGLFCTLVVPIIIIPHYIELQPLAVTGFGTSNSMSSTHSSLPAETPLDVIGILTFLYVAGIAFFFGKLCIALLSLRKVLKSCKLKTCGNLKFMETEKVMSPFSFFNTIVYNPNSFDPEALALVLTHEKVHVQQKHSLDLLFAQLCCILFWFNPFVWLYKKAIAQNLEFIADSKTNLVSQHPSLYAKLLLKHTIKTQNFHVITNFYTSLIKKRIQMLHTSNSNRLQKLKLLFVLPVIGCFIMAFNTETVYVQNPSEAKTTLAQAQNQTKDIEVVFTKTTSEVDLKNIQENLKQQNIEFKYKRIKRNAAGEITGIKTKFSGFGNSATYSVSAQEPIASFYFRKTDDFFGVRKLMEEDAKTNPEHSSSSVSNSTSQTSVTATNVSTNDSIYVETKTNNTIDSSYFKLQHQKATWTDPDGTKTDINASESYFQPQTIRGAGKRLILLNGKEVSKRIFTSLNPKTIASMNVLKDENATKIYGKKAKNGAIIIITKDHYFDSSKQYIDTDLMAYKDVDGKTKVTGGDINKVLFILDGKVVDKSVIDDVKASSIKLVNVLKDAKATAKYGAAGKDGVLEIHTKQTEGWSAGMPHATASEDKSNTEKPSQMTRSANTITYEEESNTPALEIIITKNATDALIANQIEALKNENIEAKFSKIRRNDKGEIKSIKIKLSNPEGAKSSASWQHSNEAIPVIVMGKTKSGDLFIRKQ